MLAGESLCLSIYRGFSLWRKCDFPPINGLITKVYQVIRCNQRILEHDISIFGLFTVSVYIYICYNIHIIIGYINPTSSYFYRLNPQEHVDLSMLNITILRPQEIPPSARKLLTEPRPNSVGPVEVKATGWAEVGRLKLNTEHSEHPLDLTQRTGKQICFSRINHPICGIESASFNSYVKLPEGTSYRDGFKVHTCTMLRKLHWFLKKNYNNTIFKQIGGWTSIYTCYF